MEAANFPTAQFLFLRGLYQYLTEACIIPTLATTTTAPNARLRPLPLTTTTTYFLTLLATHINTTH
jgi:hypothetical protein